jgi:putative drug exporter of the RND superfamily
MAGDIAGDMAGDIAGDMAGDMAGRRDCPSRMALAIAPARARPARPHDRSHKPSPSGSRAVVEVLGMLRGLGRAAYRRRHVIVCGWLLLILAGVGIGAGVFGQLKDSEGVASAESVRGAEQLRDAANAGPAILVVIAGAEVDDPNVRSAVEVVAHRLAREPFVHDVTTAYDKPQAGLASRDGRTSVLVVHTRPTSEPSAAHTQVDDVRALVHGKVPGATVTVGGDIAVSRDEMATSQSDLVRGELIAMPILLLALLLVFRGWRSALLPLAGALATGAGALLLLRAATNFVDIAGYAVDVVALFGLALAVDYSLLMVSRFREERAAGADVAQAVEAMVARAGRAIVFSSLTVIAAMSGLFAFGEPTFTSLAVGGVATVAVALAAALTLVPALTGIWGGKITPKPAQHATSGVFSRLALGVQRRPLLIAIASSGLLLAAALPFLGAKFSNGDYRVLPRSTESRQATDALLAAFPAMGATPIQVIAAASTDSPQTTAYIAALRRLPGVTDVSVESGLRPGFTAIDVVAAGDGQGDTAQRLVHQIRDHRPAFSTLVTGRAAFLIDFEQRISSRLPYALGLIALSTFILLFLMTGSVLVPLKALLMNMLSLGATFGALVWIFQDGHLSSLLGFESFGAIEAWVPILIFVFGFGLSMDYEVFLMSRIKEAYDETGDSNAAVVTGLQRSGRIITSAAVLVLIVFLGFAAGQNLGIKEMGLALAIAVAVDATVVRCLLVPATMSLLGRANWWAPSFLRRLHDRIGITESPERVPDSPADLIPAIVPARVDA